MPRRVSLPGADELFRTTGGAALQAPQPRQQPPVARRAAGRRAGCGRYPATTRSRRTAAGRGRGTRAPGGRAAASTAAGEAAARRPPTRAAAERAASAALGGRRRPRAHRDRRPAAAPPAQKPTPPPITATPQAPQPARRKAPRQNRRPSGRERHDEKITVYVSAEELMDLEHARLVLRGEHGLAIDRGRIVREAVAVVLADLESRGDASILVRRLRGR